MVFQAKICQQGMYNGEYRKRSTKVGTFIFFPTVRQPSRPLTALVAMKQQIN